MIYLQDVQPDGICIDGQDTIFQKWLSICFVSQSTANHSDWIWFIYFCLAGGVKAANQTSMIK